jgi:hypothetical protein
VATSLIAWKALIDAFLLVGDWMVWNIGNGKSVKIGEDPQEGETNAYKLNPYLVISLHNQGIFSYWDVVILGADLTECSNWKTIEELDFEVEQEIEWNGYMGNINSNFIFLREGEADSLCWSKNSFSGNYTVKLGYQALVEEAFIGGKLRWWSHIWRLYAPLKMKLVMWLAML